jgi:hypothetical protein
MIGRIKRVDRAGHSAYGNPSWNLTVQLDDGSIEVYRHAVQRIDRVRHRQTYRDARCEITLTRNGRGTNVRVIGQ